MFGLIAEENRLRTNKNLGAVDELRATRTVGLGDTWAPASVRDPLGTLRSWPVCGLRVSRQLGGVYSSSEWRVIGPEPYLLDRCVQPVLLNWNAS
jgi:hypothetical protein